jgi:ubiquinone/menaquinone biosynthesis C-methylase UbiE
MAPPHPLAIELARKKRGVRALIMGIGNGRNISPFVERDHTISAVDEDATKVASIKALHFPRCSSIQTEYAALPLLDRSYDLLLSTHALQHGTDADVQAALAELARVAAPGARIACVLASTADSRYGKGLQIGPQCFAPASGDEQGVAHSYFTMDQARAMFEAFFRVDSCEEKNADATVGKWAHATARGFRHWFISGERLSD